MKLSSLLAVLALTLTALPLIAQPPASPPPPPPLAPPLQPQPSAGQDAAKPSLPTSHPVEYPAPPTEGIFVSDSGVVLTLDEQRLVNKAAAQVKALTGLPVMVVTISSLEIMGADPKVTLNQYGRELFKHWSVQSAPDDKGVLLLLSRYDHTACVVLGAGWGTTQDAFKQRLETVTLVPTAVASSGYADGLTRAVNQVSAMYVSAGYPKEMPAGGVETDRAAPVVAPGAGAKGRPMVDPPVIPSASGPLGVFTWIGIGVAALVVIVVAALVAKSSKGVDGPG